MHIQGRILVISKRMFTAAMRGINEAFQWRAFIQDYRVDHFWLMGNAFDPNDFGIISQSRGSL